MMPATVDPTARLAGTALSSLNDLTVVSGYEDLLRTNRLDTLDALFAVTGGRSLEKPGLASWRERIRLTVEHEGKELTVYLKRFRGNAGAGRQRGITGKMPVPHCCAGMEWTWMHRLARDGIPCVKPIAFGEELRGRRERRSAILTEAVPGRSLESWLSKWTRADRKTIRSLIAPTAALVARLHHRGYIHRDLYLSHLFYAPASRLEESLHLIDLQRVLRPVWRRRRWVIKDLASLNFSAPTGLVSKADRLRWLKHYLGVSKLDAQAKCLAYRIVGKTLSIARHDRRRNVRLRVSNRTRCGTGILPV